MERSCAVGGGNHEERNVFVQRASRQDVQAGEVEPVRRNALHTRRGLIDQHFVCIFPMPVGGHTEADRPIRWLVENRSVFVVSELVTVVLEDLSEVIELGPSFMTGGTGEPILACESWDGLRAGAGGNKE